MKVLRTVLAAWFVVLAVSTVVAQTGAIRVTVYDAADKTPLPGASVVLRNSQQLVSMQTVITNKNGVADFPVLRAGPGYSLEVFFPSYAKQQMANIRVKIGEVQALSFILAPETVEKIVVEGKREVVDLEKTSTSTKFGADFIQDLPVQGRFYQNVLTMAAGVQDADGDGNPNVHGARATDFKAQVDGVSNQDPLTGMRMSEVNPDSIEEIEVITAGAGVEFGRAQGGFANIIQKQGSNDFEGTFNFLFKSAIFDGGAASYPGAPVPDYQHIEPAIQLSGPILKDKLWYRLSHEYIKREDPVNTGAGTEVVTTTRQINSDAFTWQASPRNKLQFTYSADPLTITNWGVSRVTSVDSSLRRELGGPTYRLGWTAPFSAKILVDSFVAFQNGYSNIMPTTRGVDNSCATGSAILPDAGSWQCRNLETAITSGSAYLTFRDRRQRLTTRSTANIFGGRMWGMDHQFKVGFELDNERYYRRQERKPDMLFVIYRPPANQNTQGELQKIVTIYGRFAVPYQQIARATGNVFSLFFEDMVKPRQNLSITLGVRIDRDGANADGFQPIDTVAEEDQFMARREQIARQHAEDDVRLDPSLAYHTAIQEAYNDTSLFTTAMAQTFTTYEDYSGFTDQLASQLGMPNESVEGLYGPIVQMSKDFVQKRRRQSINLVNTNFSPAVAVSWDPWSNGKTKFAFSARRYYGATPLNILMTEQEPAVVALRFNAVYTPGEALPQTSIGSGLNPAIAVQVVDRNLRTPYNDEMTFSFERELWAETSMKLTYIRRKFVDWPQDTDTNHYGADYGTCKLQVDAQAPFPGWITIDRDDSGRPIGDGTPDDCDGRLVWPFTEDTGSTGNAFDFRGAMHRPDGYLDTYTHNIAWGSIYMVSSDNTGDYGGWVLEVVRRQYRNWQMNASYTFSRAIGDAESWNSFLGDDRTTRDNERGYMSYDVRHSVKVNATTITPWGFRLGTAFSWESGLPYSILQQKLAQDSAPPGLIELQPPDPRARLRYPTRQRNDMRNSPFWNFDVKLDKEMNLGKGMNLQTAVDIFNLMNDRKYMIYDQFAETGYQLNGVNAGTTRIGRTYQLSMKLSF
jgi:hypothetical protein